MIRKINEIKVEMKKFPAQFQKVVDFLKEENGVKVTLGSATYYHQRMGEICIHHNHNLEKRGLYALLHEAGHSLQPETATGVNLYKIIDEDDYPRQFAMYQFLNENDAWDKAVMIAAELELEINVREFNKFREECLLTYFKSTN